MYASLKSIASYVPERILTNQDLEKMVDTTDEWITKRTGIKTRHIAADDEATSDLGVKAAELAIERSELERSDIDLIICGTISPDYLCMPSTACVIAERLGINGKPAFDISAACSGFIYLISIARAYILSGMARNVLIIGAEKLSAITDFTDRSTCILFGDGAGAAIIGRSDDPERSIIDVNIASDGRYQDFLMTPGGGSRNPCSEKTLEEHACFMKMKGNETFKLAVRTLTSDVEEILEKNKIPADQVDHFIPHQANYRIIKAVGDQLKLRADQVVLTVEKYGNTSSASIPMAMDDIYQKGQLKPGDLMLLDAFGGGLTWGSALLHFDGKTL